MNHITMVVQQIFRETKRQLCLIFIVFYWMHHMWRGTLDYCDITILGWFSNRMRMSVDNGACKSNNWLDQWQSGKLGNGSRVESFPRAFLSPTDVPVLLLNQPIVSWHKKDCHASPHKTLLVKQCNAANSTVYWHVIFILTVIVMITLLLLS